MLDILYSGYSHRHCCVPLCRSDGRYDSSLHFYHIPKDPTLREQWVWNIRRVEGVKFKINVWTVVCSKHFCKEDYSGWTPVRKRLKKGAIRSIFPWNTETSPNKGAQKRKLTTPIRRCNKRVKTEDVASDTGTVNQCQEEAACSREGTSHDDQLKAKT